MKSNNKEEIQKYLESLNKDDLLCIIKYDIYECIGCQYIYETM